MHTHTHKPLPIWHGADPYLSTWDGLVSHPLEAQEVKLNSSNASLALSPQGSNRHTHTSICQKEKQPLLALIMEKLG